MPLRSRLYLVCSSLSSLLGRHKRGDMPSQISYKKSLRSSYPADRHKSALSRPLSGWTLSLVLFSMLPSVLVSGCDEDKGSTPQDPCEPDICGEGTVCVDGLCIPIRQNPDR